MGSQSRKPGPKYKTPKRRSLEAHSLQQPEFAPKVQRKRKKGRDDYYMQPPPSWWFDSEDDWD